MQSCPKVSTDALHLTKLQTLSAFFTASMRASKSSSGAAAAAMSQAPAFVRLFPGRDIAGALENPRKPLQDMDKSVKMYEK